MEVSTKSIQDSGLKMLPITGNARMAVLQKLLTINRVEWGGCDSFRFWLVGKRRKKIGLQRLTKKFFNNWLKQENVIFRMVFFNGF